MRTDQLVALVRRHAKLAFKEGRATQKRDKVMARRWCQLRVAAFEEIVKEIDPYDNADRPPLAREGEKPRDYAERMMGFDPLGPRHMRDPL